MRPPAGKIFFKQDGIDAIAISVGDGVTEVKAGDRFRCPKKWDKVDFMDEVYSIREAYVFFVYE